MEEFTVDELFYLLGRKTAEVERTRSINEAQGQHNKRLTAALQETTAALRAAQSSQPEEPAIVESEAVQVEDKPLKAKTPPQE